MGAIAGPVVALSATGELLAQGPPGTTGGQGATGQQGPAGSSVLVPLRKGGTYIAQPGDSPLLFANTFAGAWQYTFPGSPTDGQLQIVYDEGVGGPSAPVGTFGTNALTIALSSGKIVLPWPQAGVVSAGPFTLTLNLNSWAWRWSALQGLWLPAQA
jgi:hypothetical protein